LLIATLISVEIAVAHPYAKCGEVKCVEVFSTLNENAGRAIFATLVNME